MKRIKEKIEQRKSQLKGSTKEELPSEVNFLTLPFFSLSAGDSGRDELLYRKEETTWEVVPSPKYGRPGPFDKRVFKGVQQLVDNRGLPVGNPLVFTINKLGRLMGMGSVGGDDYRRIRESLKRLVATTIRSEGTYYLKGERRYLDEVFHIFSRVVFKGEDLKGGKVAEATYLYLNSWLLDNLNAGYVRPLDYEFYKSLEGQISKRLYELLGVKFYGLLNNNGPYLRYSYGTLCDLLPAKRQPYLSKAKQILKPAHRKLKETNFLERIDWKGDAPKDLKLYYYPGKRARKEARQN